MSATCMRLLFALLLLSSAACLSPREALPVHYYSADVDAELRTRATNPIVRPELRLRRVRAAQHLGERFVWCTPAGEFGYNDLARWTEAPVQYFERAMRRELFEGGRLVRSESMAATTLDLELVAFEEMLASEPAVRVTIAVRLTDSEGRALLDQTLSETAPLAEAGSQAVAAGLRVALGRVVEQAGDVIVSGLGR